MLLSLPFHSFFIINLFLRTIFVISSEPWIAIWAGLEFNLIAFIPLLISTPTPSSTEAAIKYFIIQTFASIIFLISLVLTGIYSLTAVSILLLASAILTKIGAAPFHQWVPNVIATSSWVNLFLILSWQKIAPIVILLKALPSSSNSFLVIISCISSLVGGLGGMNQTQARTLIAFSSIGHIGWILVAVLSSTNLTLIYFVIYILNLFAITHIFMSISTSSLVSALNIIKLPPLYASVTFLLFFSLGGMPPFLGFLPKLFIIKEIILSSLTLPLILIISGSLLRLYYYISFSIIYLFNPNLNLINPNLSFSNLKVFIVLPPLILLPIFLPILYR